MVKLGRGVTLLSAVSGLGVALGAALAVGARPRDEAGARWLLGVVAAPALALEPVRDAAQLVPWADATPVFAELPGGYAVIAETRPTPVWRAVRVGAAGAAP